MNRYKSNYRAVMGVICWKIEADDTRVTVPAEAIRHAALTQSRDSDGCRIGRRNHCDTLNSAVFRILIAYF